MAHGFSAPLPKMRLVLCQMTGVVFCTAGPEPQTRISKSDRDGLVEKLEYDFGGHHPLFAATSRHLVWFREGDRFYTDLEVRQSNISRRRWQVQIGEGGPEVRMKSVSGKMRLLSSFDARGQVPGIVTVTQSRDERKEILSRLSEGEINVDEALKELAP